jgi:hypothetical protein
VGRAGGAEDHDRVAARAVGDVEPAGGVDGDAQGLAGDARSGGFDERAGRGEFVDPVDVEVVDEHIAGGRVDRDGEHLAERFVGGDLGDAAQVPAGGRELVDRALDTTTLGPHTYTVTALSRDGQSATGTIEYTVVEPRSRQPEAPESGPVQAAQERAFQRQAVDLSKAMDHSPNGS